jgi:hypothetical protein
MMKNDNENALAHGAGAGLLAMLGMLGRGADDVARLGVNSLDDVGRACVTSTDDIGTIMSRSGDDLLGQVDDFHVRSYIDDLQVETPPAQAIVKESDDGVSFAVHVTKEAAEATFKIIEMNNRDDRK